MKMSFFEIFFGNCFGNSILNSCRNFSGNYFNDSIDNNFTNAFGDFFGNCFETPLAINWLTALETAMENTSVISSWNYSSNSHSHFRLIFAVIGFFSEIAALLSRFPSKTYSGVPPRISPRELLLASFRTRELKKLEIIFQFLLVNFIRSFFGNSFIKCF